MTKQRRTRKPVEEEPTGIVLDKKFRLMPLDDQNIELQELRTVTTKATEDKPSEKVKKWMFCSYSGSVQSALKSYCKLRCIRAKDQPELLSIIADIHDKIDNLFTFVPEHNCKCKKA